MKVIIEIGHEKYLLRREPNNEQLTMMLGLLRELHPIDQRHTPNYQETRYVPERSKKSLRVSIVSEDEVCTIEEFEELVAANPREKKEVANA